MKYVSDIDMTTDGKFAVQWEYFEGGYFWEKFETEAERKQAITENNEYLDAHKDLVDKYNLDAALSEVQRDLEEIENGTFIGIQYYRSKAIWYKNQMLKGKREFTIDDFDQFRDFVEGTYPKPKDWSWELAENFEPVKKVA